MKVVISAMITSIANSVGGMTPRSSPMLRMMSSVRPRVFIRIPTASDSRQCRPTALAAAVDPPHLRPAGLPPPLPEDGHKQDKAEEQPEFRFAAEEADLRPKAGIGEEQWE